MFSFWVWLPSHATVLLYSSPHAIFFCCCINTYVAVRAIHRTSYTPRRPQNMANTFLNFLFYMIGTAALLLPWCTCNNSSNYEYCFAVFLVFITAVPGAIIMQTGSYKDKYLVTNMDIFRLISAFFLTLASPRTRVERYAHRFLGHNMYFEVVHLFTKYDKVDSEGKYCCLYMCGVAISIFCDTCNSRTYR